MRYKEIPMTPFDCQDILTENPNEVTTVKTQKHALCLLQRRF